MKKALKILGCAALIVAAIVASYLIYMTVTDYKPDNVVKLEIKYNKEETLSKNKVLSIMTYNLGYCGLDKGQDFFMDGGKGSRSKSKEKTLENLKGIYKFLNSEKTSFMVLQEVDKDSTRSYHVNEYGYLKDNFKDYGSVFTLNYKVPWVPVPILKPHGKVRSGLVTFSKYNIENANRYKYPGEEKWPRQMAMLDRCFIESRMKVENGKEFVLINSHLSAYDKGGMIRKQQLGFLKEHIKKEYEKGNYVLVAGDWNHLMPGTDPTIFKSEEQWPEWLKKIPDDFLPQGFKWAADTSIPTNRTVDRPYEEGKNYVSVIDGFLVSGNVEVKSVKGYQLEFKYTDHNPVKMEFILK
ncbi:endonuclease/exonuclease/phosphatase family protein [Haloimpatiens sp. FM7330]|uniref:endonuclease/exonuclease/phosphatase family protein n=1 Tax=Haloimpatiens sp. FM7330 TaxID=3298610 RepID=UPI003634862A